MSETDRLLAKPPAPVYVDPESAPNVSASDPAPLRLSSEILYLLANGLPVSLSYMLQASLQSVSVVIVGNMLDAAALSAAAQGFMLAMVSAWCLAIGGSTAFDTLASPVFSVGRQAEVGILYLRTCLVLMVLFVPVAAVWVYAASLLRMFGQPEDLCENVQTFLRVLVYGAPGYILFETTKKFCQVQGIMQASTVTLCITSPLNVVLNYVMVNVWGLRGAAAATSLSYWLSFAGLLAYSIFGRPKQCWHPTWGPLLDWPVLRQVVQLVVPGFFMVATEWWAFEIVALAAGRLPAPAISAQSVIMTMDQILNTLPFGLGVAASMRIGYLLGHGESANNVRSLRISTYAATILATAQGAVVLLALLLTRRQFGLLFSDDPPTIELVSRVLPLVAAFQVFDGWAGACGGVLRGIGRQELGAAINLAAYYVLALPLGIALAFRGNQALSGLWIGQDVALCLVGLGEMYLVCCVTQWHREAQKAAVRTDHLRH